MTKDAAKTIERQCRREYGFGKDYGVKQRATDISLVSHKERRTMPTDNVIAERDFAKFDHLARVAKYRNNKFTAKGIREDMMLYKSTEGVANKTTKIVDKVLQIREKDWTAKQKQIHRKIMQEKLAKKSKTNNYTDTLLQKCKTWNGPVTSVDELQMAIKRNPDNQTALVRTELAYYRNTHPDDVRSNPDLFKWQGPTINHDLRLENFCLILADCEIETPGGTAADLPTKET